MNTHRDLELSLVRRLEQHLAPGKHSVNYSYNGHY